MKNTDIELNISNIIDVYKGHIPRNKIECKNRKSDCFVYVTSGNAEYIFNDKKQKAETGNVIYLSKNSNYSINVCDDNYFFICIDFIFSNNKSDILENEIYKTKGILMLENTFEKMYKYWHLGNFSDKIKCKALIYSIYSEIAKSVFSLYVPRDRRKQIEELSTFISKNINNPDLNVKMLSNICNISEVHLRRIFSHIYHTSPIKFITSLRIKKAKELLSQESIAISEISLQCGFKNQYYFSKIFKAEINMTPTEYRNNYKDNL